MPHDFGERAHVGRDPECPSGLSGAIAIAARPAAMPASSIALAFLLRRVAAEPVRARASFQADSKSFGFRASRPAQMASAARALARCSRWAYSASGSSVC